MFRRKDSGSIEVFASVCRLITDKLRAEGLDEVGNRLLGEAGELLMVFDSWTIRPPDGEDRVAAINRVLELHRTAEDYLARRREALLEAVRRQESPAVASANELSRVAFGHLLRHYRTDSGAPIAELAREIGVSEERLAAIEAGGALESDEELRRIVEVLDRLRLVKLD